jgi:hypothetical protein
MVEHVPICVISDASCLEGPYISKFLQFLNVLDGGLYKFCRWPLALVGVFMGSSTASFQDFNERM